MTIVVARAIPTVDVPDLTGQTQTEASDTLTRRRARAARTQRDVTDPTQDGIVLDQKPPAGGSS